MGLQLRRFDICSPLSQYLVAFNAKTNMTHLCAQLEKTASDHNSYYKSLCDSVPPDSETPYSFRIGHAYYGRNYVTSKFPALYFDTNLGSNFITGASGLFDSAQIYRLNSGFRNLNGQIDTDILEKATNRVACMGIDRLNEEQRALVTENHFNDDDYKKLGLIGTTRVAAQTFLSVYWKTDVDNPDDKLKHLRFLLLALVVNWRSYIFGADGQGVEHSDVEVESARMALMLAYQLADECEGKIPTELIQHLVEFFHAISKAYWESTIGECTQNMPSKYRIKQFQGFKSPQSVVLVKAERS
ncbi:hypothetical protein FACS1894185_5350 [Betaproteobacteria bacterium]|nr:hypothetical protein FACS1894185_5350 [Betaproteobacteria bacterium]